MPVEKNYVELLQSLEKRRSKPETRTSMNRPQREFGGIYAPVSGAAIESAEKALGFALPPLLRAIYREIGNGGFGPGTGLLGLEDGYTDADLLDLTLVEYHQMLVKEEGLDWPKKLLTICNVGCGMTYAVNCARRDFPVVMAELQPPFERVGPFDELMQRWAAGKD